MATTSVGIIYMVNENATADISTRPQTNRSSVRSICKSQMDDIFEIDISEI